MTGFEGLALDLVLEFSNSINPISLEILFDLIIWGEEEERGGLAC